MLLSCHFEPGVVGRCEKSAKAQFLVSVQFNGQLLHLRLVRKQIPPPLRNALFGMTDRRTVNLNSN